MSVTIPDDILRQANMTEQEFRLELALFLFEKRILTLGKASEFAEVSQYEFQQAISRKGISITYDMEEFKKDLQRIRKKYPGT